MFRFLSLLLRSLVCTLLLAGVARAGTVNFNGKDIGNCTRSGTTYSCGTAFLGATDTASIFTGYTVIVNGALQLGWDQGLKMTGTARLETTGTNGIRLAGANPANINVTGGTIKAGGDFVLGANRQDITADVIATTVDITGPGSKITGSVTTTGAITLVARSEITGAVSAGSLSAGSDVILGGSVTTTGAIYLQSRTTVAGAVDGASIKTESGAILRSSVKVSGLADFESGSSVTGKVDAGSLTLRPAGTTITGNVNVTGDVTMGSGTVINGDLVGNNVKTQSSSARINGNALVYSLYLAWDATVSKVVTCKVPADFPCSCVTYESGYNYRPTCAAATPSTAHHFQITHGGSALTCQPQTVTVTACANAACTAPHYTGAIKTTLQPGGAEFTVTGGVNNAATVSRSTAGTAVLSASGASNASTCANSAAGSTSCNMVFSDNGLTLSVPDHVSMTTAKVTLQALKSAPAPNAGKSCVPLVASTTATVNFSCSQINPANGARPPVALADAGSAAYTSVSCGSGSTGVPLKFDKDGLATANLQYPEVGNVGLSASYTSGTTGASTPAATAFTVAPARFRLKATRANTTPVLPAGVFARASEPFTLQISAVNALADDPNNMDANVTKNFGRESTPEGMLPTVKVTIPDGGAGALTGTFGDITDGTRVGTYNFDDVGTITITALNLRTGYYMGNKTAGFDTRGVLELGRFIPDHFDTMLPTLVDSAPAYGQLLKSDKKGNTMDCADAGAAVQPCPERLVYSKQPFYIVVKAYNGAKPTAALTRNYSGVQARPITLSSWNAANGATAVKDMFWSQPASTSRFTFIQGVGTAASADNLPYFAFPGVASPTRIFVRAVDTDNVTSRRTDAVELGITAISGQLYIAPNFGSASSPMPMKMEARFYNNGAYRLNPAFQGPTPALANTSLVYSNCQKALTADARAATCTTAAQLKLFGSEQPAFVNGKAGFRLQGPGVGPGAVGISLRAPCAGAACAPADWIDYLPATIGTATFGIYRAGPVIYTREVY